jgi:hypothetical protein
MTGGARRKGGSNADPGQDLRMIQGIAYDSQNIGRNKSPEKQVVNKTLGVYGPKLFRCKKRWKPEAKDPAKG